MRRPLLVCVVMLFACCLGVVVELRTASLFDDERGEKRG